MVEIPFTAPTTETAEFHIVRAAWSALGWGLLLLVLGVLAFADVEMPLGFGRISALEGGLMLLLGHGVMIRNRVAACLILPFWLGMFFLVSRENLVLVPVRLVFLYFFSTGVWSVFIHHKEVAEMGGPED